MCYVIYGKTLSRYGYRMKIKGYFFNCPFFSKLSQWIVVNWTITSGIPWTRSASSWLLSLGGSRPLTASLRKSQLAILQLTKKCYLIGRTMKILYESKNWPKQETEPDFGPSFEKKKLKTVLGRIIFDKEVWHCR